MLWRWSVRFCLLVVWTNHISTLPLDSTPDNAATNHNLTSRAARQADPDKECCPCPGSQRAADSAGSQRAADSEGSASMLTPAVRSAGCNCQRDAEGAASSLFDIPSQMIGAFVRPNDQKEDPKPLLHPEVGLANNFLETLREATDEEYRDAVARDAARAADTDAMIDPQQEASRNIVTIILKPPQLQPEDDEDVLASGTHIQESRCIHSPLGNERSAFESPQILMPSLLTEIMHIPGIQRMNKRRNNLLHLDNGGSASNVAENIVESPKEDKRMAFPKEKLSSVNSGQDDPDTASGMRSNSQPLQDKVIKTDKIRKIPDFNVKSAINDINDRIKRLNAKLKKPHVPNLTIKDRNIDTTSLRSNDVNIDNCPASSNVQDNKLGRSTDGSSATDSQATSRSLLIPNNDVKNILTSNIFKLKDVELVPTSKNTDVKMTIPNLKLPSIDDLITQSKANTPEPFKIPTLSDLFRNSILNPEKKIVAEVIPPENTDVASTTDIDSSEKIHTVQTEILDSVPKTTDSIIAASNNNVDLRSQSAPCDPVNIAETKASVINTIPETNIIESLPIDPQPDSGTSRNNNIEEKDNSDEAEDNSETVSDGLRNEIQVPNKPNDPIDIAETKDSDVENSVENVTKKPTLRAKLGKLRKPTSALLEKLKKDLSPKINSLKTQPVPKNEKFNVPEDPEIFSSSSLQNNKNVGDSLVDASNQKETRNEVADMTGNPDTEGRNSEVIEEDGQDLSESESQEDENNTIIPIQTVSDINGKENEVNSCLSGLVKESTGENINEMSVGASSPIISSSLPDRQTSLLGSLLKQENIIVEPTSLIDGASNTILPSLPALNVNSVPTFENLREQLANLFGNLNVNGQDEENTLRSSEDVSDEDSESEPSMASEASDPISQITGSSFQPFKEINLNLFKLSPVNLATPLTLPRLSNAGLNFDSVKARVKVPNLQWKPLKLESTFGQRDGILGASLSLEPFNKNIQSLLPKPSIPSLDEMTSSLVARAEDLLKTQPKLIDTSSLRNTDPLIHLDTLRDSLHSNAANAMNSLQQTLESSLDEAKVRADGLLGNTRFAQPENLLDIARFDVDDKLKELHSNLADHLSSVHEKLMDPSTFSTLASPLLGSPLEFPPLTPPNLLQSASSNVNKKKPRNKLSRPVAKSRTALKLSEPAFKPKLREQNKKTTSPVERRILKSNLAKPPSWLSNNKVNTPKVSKPKPKQSLFTKTSTPRFPNTKELSSTKAATKPPFKLPRPTPRPLAIEKPKISPVRPIPPIERRPLLRKRVQQTPDTERFKAALISTTTPRALFPASFKDTHQRLFAPKTATTVTTPKPQRVPSFPARNLGSSRLLQATPKAFEHLKFPKDVYGSPSEQVLSKAEPTSDIFKLGSFTPNNERSDLLTRAREQLKPKFKVNIGKMELPERTGAFKTISPQIPFERSSEIEDDVTTNTDILKPKVLLDENDMLAKLKDTIKNKLGIDLKSPLDKKALSLQSSPDMDEGASESNGMNVVDDAMVENVAYKCNMVCTKERS